MASGQLHAPAAISPGQGLPYPLDRRFGWFQSRPGSGDEEKKVLCPCRELNPSRAALSLVIELPQPISPSSCWSESVSFTNSDIVLSSVYLVVIFERKTVSFRSRLVYYKALLVKYLICWATGWTIGILGFDFRWRLTTFLFTTASRTALDPTQPPIQWVRGAISLGVKRPWCEADLSPPSSAEVK